MYTGWMGANQTFVFFSFVRHASKHFQKASYWRHGQPASTTQSFNLFLNLFEQPIIRAKHALCHMQEINVKQETGAGNIDSIQDRFYIFDYQYSTVLINSSLTQLQQSAELLCCWCPPQLTKRLMQENKDNCKVINRIRLGLSYH